MTFEAQPRRDASPQKYKIIVGGVGLTTFNTDGSVKNGEALLMNIEYDSHGNWTRKTRLIQSEKVDLPNRLTRN